MKPQGALWVLEDQSSKRINLAAGGAASRFPLFRPMPVICELETRTLGETILCVDSAVLRRIPVKNATGVAFGLDTTLESKQIPLPKALKTAATQWPCPVESFN